MRLFATLFLLSTFFNLTAQSTNVSFRSSVTYSGQKLSNIWGYAAGGYEYALVGAQLGLSIVNVTNPDNPVPITQISGPNSQWREIKTYQNYAYIVSEGGGGIQIVNLSNLPNANVTVTSYFGNGAINNQLTRAHALQVDEVKGYLYIYGSNLQGGRALVFNLNPNPASPNYVGYVNFIGYVHDGYANNDTLYAGHIYAGMFAIYNMTNKTSPVLLGSQTTPLAFTHNTWRSGTTLFTTDEKTNSTLAAYNISDPGNITLLDQIQSNPGSGSIVHNTYILNSYAVTSWYRDGFTIVDVSRPSNLVQVGNYDTYSGTGNGFDGAWGVYPYLPSGNILISNIAAPSSSNGEMIVLTPTYVRGCYVEGTITNSQNGQLINGASVQLLSTSTNTTSLANGQYKMGQVTPGTFTLRITKSGFFTHQSSVTLANGQLNLVNVALQPASLPIELERFDAQAEGREALLSWTTGSEIDNAGFEVEHGTPDATSWTNIGFVPGHGTTAVAADYRYRVRALRPGDHLFRLRQLDYDGTATYSDIRRVTIDGPPRAELWPNVVRRGQESAMLFLSDEQPAAVTVFNAGGQPVFRAEARLALELPTQTWQPGAYVVIVQSAHDRIALRLMIE